MHLSYTIEWNVDKLQPTCFGCSFREIHDGMVQDRDSFFLCAQLLSKFFEILRKYVVDV